MADEFERGDRVEWNTSQGTTTGRVQRKLTAEMEHTRRRYSLMNWGHDPRER